LRMTLLQVTGGLIRNWRRTRLRPATRKALFGVRRSFNVVVEYTFRKARPFLYSRAGRQGFLRGGLEYRSNSGSPTLCAAHVAWFALRQFSCKQSTDCLSP